MDNSIRYEQAILIMTHGRGYDPDDRSWPSRYPVFWKPTTLYRPIHRTVLFSNHRPNVSKFVGMYRMRLSGIESNKLA